MKFTLIQFLRKYPNDEACLEEIKKQRWPDGIFCKVCQKITKHYKLNKRNAYSCEYCRKQVYPLAGTIFEKSTTPLRLWFYAMYLMVQTRAGISAKQLERELGVTYKTAWRMFKQIRVLMAEPVEKLTGEVEADETFIGGKAKNRAYVWDNNERPKAVVMSMVQRGGKAYLRHIPNTGKWTLLEQIKTHVDPSARVLTDEWAGYKQLLKYGYLHDVVNHKNRQYVRGDIHTQNIECVWSIVKRGITGVYRIVSKKYLQTYIDEYAWRYNHRVYEGEMFNRLLNQVALVKVLAY